MPLKKIPCYIKTGKSDCKKWGYTMKEGQALQGSPYVEQIEKYASSLKQLSHTFLELEAHKEEFREPILTGCLTG